LESCFLIASWLWREGLFVDEHALLTLHRGVADHAGSTAYEGQGLMAGALKVLEHHDAYEVADVEGVGCRVDSEVGGGHPLFEFFFGTGHYGVDHSAPGEFFNKVHCYFWLR